MAKRGNQGRGGVPAQYQRNQGRNRSALLDEDSLQERSRRLADGESAEWKPSSLETQQEQAEAQAHEAASKPRGWRGWLTIVAWVLICLSIVGFFTLMWLPTHPFWLVATVSGVFAVGVLSLFIASQGSRANPKLDENGTAL